MRDSLVGLSFNYSQLQTGSMSDITLQDMIKLSYMYSDLSTQFSLSVKNQVPTGYKYNCASHPASGDNITCISDVQLYGLADFYYYSLNDLFYTTVGYDM